MALPARKASAPPRPRARRRKPTRAPLPLVLWAVPAECQWTDLAARDPHRPLARMLVGALAVLRRR